MRDLGKQLGLPVEVYGPETHMTFIVQRAIENIFPKEGWVDQIMNILMGIGWEA